MKDNIWILLPFVFNLIKLDFLFNVKILEYNI